MYYVADIVSKKTVLSLHKFKQIIMPVLGNYYKPSSPYQIRTFLFSQGDIIVFFVTKLFHIIKHIGILFNMKSLRLRHRKGRCVEYLSDDGLWKSTGCDTKDEAYTWFYSSRGKENITFRNFAENIFIDDQPGSFRYIQKMANKHTHPEWWKSSDGILHRYLLPRFGKVAMVDLSTSSIQDWYLTFEGVSGKKLKAASKKKVLDCLSTIMDWAVFRGVIDKNPVSNVIKISERGEGRCPYTDEELAAMFPENRMRLMQIWGTPMWAIFFLIMRDTGWRPGEVAGLKAGGYYSDLHGVYTTQSVDSFDKKLQNSVKTSDTGYTYRVGLVSDRTASLIEEYIEYLDKDELMFTVNGQVVTSGTARIHFMASLVRAGVEYNHRPPYCLRTTFQTNAAKTLSREQVEELMGHKQWRACYDKRTPEDIVRKVRNFQ